MNGKQLHIALKNRLAELEALIELKKSAKFSLVIRNH